MGWDGYPGGPQDAPPGGPPIIQADPVVRRLKIVLGVLIVLTVGAGGWLLLTDDDDDGDPSSDIAATSTTSQDDETTTTAAEREDDTSTTEPSEPASDLPPPTIPSSASPPTTAPGTESIDYPIGFPADEPGNSIPLWGEIVVDLEPNGHEDVPVAMEEGQVVTVIAAGDDGVQTHIEIYQPDGNLHGSWDDGEPGVIAGWEWVGSGDQVPATGTYVFRVIHTGGKDDPFLLRFFKQQ